MALLENKVIKVIKDAQETDIQLYSDPADITQDDDYAIFPIVGTDGTTMMYAQAVRADIESLPDTVQRTPLYYYPAEGIISAYQLLNAAVPPITLWAVVIFPGEGQTIHCYTPSEAEFRAGRGEDHTTSFLLEDGGTYEAKAVVDPEYASTYIPGDITITDGGDPINKTINLIITDQPSDVELSVSPSSVTATYTGTREEAIHSASFDVSSLEQLSTTVNIDLVITSTDGSDFEGTFDIKRGITPYSVPINMGKASSSTEEDSVIVDGQSISSTNGSYSVNMSLNLGGMIEGGSMLYFDFTNTKKKPVNLSYYALNHIPNYQTISEIPQENINYLSSGLKANNTSNMFDGCKNLLSIDFDSFNIDTSNVSTMSFMFYGCNSLTTLDLSSFDTSNVTDMYSMFDECNSLATLDLSSFNTSNVSNMSFMFRNCWSLKTLDLSSFDTSNVSNMSYMFYGCWSLTTLDLSSFNTSNVTDMSYMFYGCSKLTILDLSSFNTSNVTDMSYMFSACSTLTEIKGIIDLKSTSNLNHAFEGCPISSSTPVQIKNPPSTSNWWQDAGFDYEDQFVIVP